MEPMLRTRVGRITGAGPSAGSRRARKAMVLALATASLAVGLRMGVVRESRAGAEVASPPNRSKAGPRRTPTRPVSRPSNPKVDEATTPRAGLPTAGEVNRDLPLKSPSPLELPGGPSSLLERLPGPPAPARGHEASGSPRAPESSPSAEVKAPARVRVRDEAGRAAVARMHGRHGDQVVVIMPDGQLGIPGGLVPTEEPFRVASVTAMQEDLIRGPFAGFEALQSTHYLVLSQASSGFAEDSLKLLEDLYKGLAESLRKRRIPIHDLEFPLVAVIFRTEADFRAFKPVDPNVQAYYEIFTNRIYFYEHSDRDAYSPEVAALRKPQTVAHEGAHQILQNIGVQPRLAAWPSWLVEGLAEYCASPTTTRKGANWGGLGAINPLHMATIRDLHDPLSPQLSQGDAERVGRDPRKPLIEYLVTRTELSPTDYALSWALTHYLATKRLDDFLAFLETMRRAPPLETRTPDEHIAAFRAAFGRDLSRMDKAVHNHLAKQKKYDALPYYAVVFEQPIGVRVKRAALVSQSPSMIRQWLETVPSPRGGPTRWEVFKHPTRTRALLRADRWIQSR